MVSKAARANLEAHIAGERARNLEALMAPLAASPSYVVPGYRLDGKAAARCETGTITVSGLAWKVMRYSFWS